MKTTQLIMITLSLTLLASCATKGDLKKEREHLLMELEMVKAEQAVMKDSLKKELQEEMRSELREEVMEKGKENLILEMKEDVFRESKKDLDQYKEVINAYLAEKLNDQESLIKEEILRSLIDGPFIPLLEEKIREGMSEQQSEMFKENKDAFIKDCVERVLDEVVGKEIGIGKHGAELLK